MGHHRAYQPMFVELLRDFDGFKPGMDNQKLDNLWNVMDQNQNGILEKNESQLFLK